MPEITAAEQSLIDRYTLDQNLVSWKPDEKLALIKVLTRQAGLDENARILGVLRTQEKRKGTDNQWDPKETLYVARDGASKLADKRSLSVIITERKITDGLAIWGARCTGIDSKAPNGIRDVDATGVTSIVGLKENMVANKLMHAETKAFRRAILNFCGLAILDESETDTMQNFERVELEDKPTPPPVKTQTKSDPPAPPPAEEKPPEKPPAGSPPPAKMETPPKAPPPPPGVKVGAPAKPAAPDWKAKYPPAPANGDEIVGADDKYVQAIVAYTKENGVDIEALSNYLANTHQVTNANRAQTLTAGKYARIMNAIPQLKKAGG